MKNTEISIRMSGLGGQGVVTAAHILGSAAVLEKKNATVNPFFGAEKRLAPAESYVRISDTNIYDVGEIVYPEIIMIFHPDVIIKGKSYTMPFFSGIRKDGIIIVNSKNEIKFDPDDEQKIKELNLKTYFVSATEVAIEIGKTEMSSNIAMLGFLVGITKIVSLKTLCEATKDRFSGKSKLVASATTTALDDSVKKQYAKIEQLISANTKILEETYKKGYLLVN